MRFVHLYLVGYFALVIGAGFALWQAGILTRVSPLWSGLTLAAALLPGLLLGYTSLQSSSPAISTPE